MWANIRQDTWGYAFLSTDYAKKKQVREQLQYEIEKKTEGRLEA